MAQRVIPIKVDRPDYSETWENDTYDFVDEHRQEIIGDLLDILRQPVQRLAKYTRWAPWEHGVLAHVGDPSECQKVIAERQAEMDDDANESEVVRQGFCSAIKARGYNPDLRIFFITNGEAAQIVAEATREAMPTNKVKAYLDTLAIPELRKSASDGVRGYRWTGTEAPSGEKAKWLSTGHVGGVCSSA
jgi:hypothetical protein